ncbi:MAG: hypothetical protein M3198_09345 [Actinomycetota bacterium]|nr:hypothetical protein [Actinomycetota bacterium]
MIHITEIKKMLQENGVEDAKDLLEIRFDKPGVRSGVVDEEMKNKVITADCPFGNVVIVFDDEGLLQSIEVV